MKTFGLTTSGGKGQLIFIGLCLGASIEIKYLFVLYSYWAPKDFIMKIWASLSERAQETGSSPRKE